MDEFRIVCVKKPDRFSTHEAITSVRLANDTNEYARQQVVYWIDNDKYRFYVLEGAGSKVYVGTAVGPSSEKYIRTYRDGQWTNNLLSLPECPRMST